MSWDKFIDLLKSSAVTQGVLSILVIGGWVYMIVAGVPVPPAFEAVAGLVVGFFFGGKVQARLQT
jgi:hypothetical protein